MRTLVTGAGGFVGRHLQSDLEDHDHHVVPVEAPGRAAPGMREADICEPEALDATVKDVRPEACVHLASQAFVPRAWEEPAQTFNVNAVGTMNLLTSLRQHAPECRVLVVSTAQVYGPGEAGGKIAEDHPMAPATMYAITKMAADLGALAFGARHGLPVMTARPTNHIGPGQSPDYVVPAFARQVARIARDIDPPRMRVGNLESRRSFMDVRDVVHAYRLILERGVAGRPYNLAGPELHRVGEILDLLGDLAGVHPETERDPALYRPTDRALDLATDRIHEDTGWTAQRSLRETLADVLDEAMREAESAGG